MHEQGAPRIEWQILKSPSGIKPAHAVVQRVRDHTKTADGFRRNQCRAQREQQKGRRMSLSLEFLVHRKLAEQRGGHRVGAIALLWLGQERALDLRGAQGDVAGDPS